MRDVLEGCQKGDTGKSAAVICADGEGSSMILCPGESPGDRAACFSS